MKWHVLAPMLFSVAIIAPPTRGSAQPVQNAIWVAASASTGSVPAEADAAALVRAYTHALHQAVQIHWMRPDSAQPGLRCVVHIHQDEAGKILDLRIAEPCNGDEATRQSIEAAVRRAEPLPHAGYESVLAQRLQLVFRYD